MFGSFLWKGRVEPLSKAGASLAPLPPIPLPPPPHVDNGLTQFWPCNTCNIHFKDQLILHGYDLAGGYEKLDTLPTMQDKITTNGTNTVDLSGTEEG